MKLVGISKMILWFLALFMMFQSVAGANSCNSSLHVLENHLYAGRFNQKELSRVFQMHQAPRYVKVEYVFEGTETDQECSVTYYWSVGGFLLIQPPSVFRFTSLYFNYYTNDLQTITLALPEECRPLVRSTQECSCKADGDTLLDVLTHHLFQYSKYNNPDQVIRDDKSIVQSICREELNRCASTRVKVFLIVTLLLPLASMTLFSFIMRKYDKTIERSLARPTSHHNLAGLVLTGATLMMYVIVMDIGAVYYSSIEGMYGDISLPFSIHITYITFGFDAVVVLYSMSIFIAYFSRYRCFCKEGCSDSECLFTISKCFCIPFFYIMLGVRRSEEIWLMYEPDGNAINELCHHQSIQNGSAESTLQMKPQKIAVQNRREAWIIVSFLYAALLCMSSHLGYTFVAWVSDPGRTSFTALLALLILLCFFLLYREIYKSSKSIATVSICKRKWDQSIFYIPPCAVVVLILRFIWSYLKTCKETICKCFNRSNCIRSATSPNNRGRQKSRNNFSFLENKNEGLSDESTSTNEFSASTFSFKSLLIALSWGPVFVALVGVVLTTFFLLPMPMIELANYLQNMLYILVSALVSYRILLYRDSSSIGFSRKFGKHNESCRIHKNVEDVDETNVDNELMVDNAYKANTEIQDEDFYVIIGN